MSPIEKFREALRDVHYKNWLFSVRESNGTYFLQINFAESGVRQSCRKWILSQWMTKSEIIQTAFKAVLAAEEHETREKFKYNGRAIFGPHFDVEQLYCLCGDPDSLDVRSEATYAHS